MPSKLLAFLLPLALLLPACAQPVYREAAGTGTAGGQAAAAKGLVGKLKSSGLQVWLEWERMPSDEDFGSFLLKVGRPNLADGSPVLLDAADEVSVELWMPSMGHGSSPVSVEKIDLGTFRASQVFFTMPGDWEIRVEVREEARRDQVALPVRI